MRDADVYGPDEGGLPGSRVCGCSEQSLSGRSQGGAVPNAAERNPADDGGERGVPDAGYQESRELQSDFRIGEGKGASEAPRFLTVYC